MAQKRSRSGGRPPERRPRSRRHWPGRALVAAVAMAVASCADDPQQPVDPCAGHPGEIPPPPNPCVMPDNVAAVITQLGDAYRGRDYARLSPLLHNDFLFILHPDPNANPPLPENWDEQEELHIHRRMFDPQDIPPTDPPLDPGLWLASVSINLTPAQLFAERPEFYRSATNTEGLDPARWKAWGADYNAEVLFDTQSDLDFLIMGRAWFVVAEDLAKPFGEPGRFTLYRWQDLGDSPGAGTASVEPLPWSGVKLLYK